MDYECITYEEPEQHIAVVTLNRPQRLNALSIRLLEELYDAVRGIDRNPDIRAWILTGAARPDGRPNFSAGVDLREAAEGPRRDPHLGTDLTDYIDDMLKPSVAVIDGICTTGAGELAVSCDIRLIGEAAQISDWHLKNLGTGLGGWGSSTRWSRLVGPAKAKEVFLTGKVMNAEEALRCGWASSVHPSAALREAGLATARAIAAMRPEGVRLTLAHLDHTAEMPKDQALRWAKLLPQWLDVTSDIGERGREVMKKSIERSAAP